MKEKTVADVFDTFAGRQRDMVYFLIGYAIENRRWYLYGNGDYDNAHQKELRAIYRGLNDEQRKVVDYLYKEAVKMK